MVRDLIFKVLREVAGTKDIHLELPENEEFGDYSTNVAMKIATRIKGENPKAIAEGVVEKLEKDKDLAKIVDKIEVAGPGFINFWLSKDSLLNNLANINTKKEKLVQSNVLKGKRYLLEHTSPNTIKTLHVGHVRNNVLGMAVHNLLEAIGAQVSLDAVNNDRGIHVMKAIWAYQKYGKGKIPGKNQKPDQFVDKFYIKGAKEAENKKVKGEMQELLRKWEAGDSKVRIVWKKLRDWTFKGFEESYKRLGSHHDRQWFESDFYEEGRKIVLDGLEKGVFKKLPDGAILTNLEKYNLPDAIILRTDGTTMYHTQDLRLTQLKQEKFPSDLYIWDIGPEQNLYLKQLFAICEQLGIGKREDYFHLSYGYVFLKGKGKMSSRQGTVISADWLMDEMVARAKKIIEESETSRGLSESEKTEVAEAVGVGAIKYGFLKVARETDIQFDMDESISLEGNSGPYLQYTFARTQSVLAKSKRVKDLPAQAGQESKSNLELNNEEILVLRSLVHFPEVIGNAAESYSPNLLCNYLFDLAQKFNAFYNKHRILPSEKEIGNWKLEIGNFRLAITAGVGQVLKTGLTLLGISTPMRM